MQGLFRRNPLPPFQKQHTPVDQVVHRSMLLFKPPKVIGGESVPVVSALLDGFHDLGFQFLAEFGVVLQQRLHGLASLGQFAVLV